MRGVIATATSCANRPPNDMNRVAHTRSTPFGSHACWRAAFPGISGPWHAPIAATTQTSGQWPFSPRITTRGIANRHNAFPIILAVSKLLPPNFCAAQPACRSVLSEEHAKTWKAGCTQPRTCRNLREHVTCREGAEQDRNLTLGPPLTLSDEWN
jgi:hypothetical protein